MALVFCDGFDHYATADLPKKWTNWFNAGQNYTTISTAYARPPGGQGVRLNSDGSNNRCFYKSYLTQVVTAIVGGNFQFEGFGGYALVSLCDSSSGITQAGQFQVRVDGTAHVAVYSGGTLLATSTNVLTANTWYHIECKVTINNSTGSYEVRVNGSSVGWIPAATSKNTRQQSSNAWVDSVLLNGSGSIAWCDDFYVLDNTGSVANDFIGPQKIITVYPTGAGNSAQFTGNYASNFANVNESVSDGDATFNQSSTAGHIDLFDFDNVPTGTISGIQHVIQARQDAGSARVIRAKTRIGGTNYDGSSANLSGSHLFITTPVTLNPADSAAWDAADVNGAEFGYELVS